MTHYYYFIQGLQEHDVNKIYYVKVGEQKRHLKLLQELIKVSEDSNYYLSKMSLTSTPFISRIRQTYKVDIQTISIVDLCRCVLLPLRKKSKAQTSLTINFE